MSKFLKMLSASNKQIKEQKAAMIAEDALDAQTELLRDLKKEQRELERKLMTLSDISPDSSLSLKAVNDNFDAKEWAKSIQEVKIELANKKVEVLLAEETFDEWFKD